MHAFEKANYSSEKEFPTETWSHRFKEYSAWINKKGSSSELPSYQCRKWDLNPHSIATIRTWTVRVCHSAIPANRHILSFSVIFVNKKMRASTLLALCYIYVRFIYTLNNTVKNVSGVWCCIITIACIQVWFVTLTVRRISNGNRSHRC